MINERAYPFKVVGDDDNNNPLKPNIVFLIIDEYLNMLATNDYGEDMKNSIKKFVK